MDKTITCIIKSVVYGIRYVDDISVSSATKEKESHVTYLKENDVKFSYH